jgi:hypothetical protein
MENKTASSINFCHHQLEMKITDAGDIAQKRFINFLDEKLKGEDDITICWSRLRTISLIIPDIGQSLHSRTRSRL